MPVNLPIQTINPADNYNERSLGTILWAEVPSAFAAVDSLNAAAPFNFTDIHTTGAVIFNNNGAAAGYLWASADTDGTGEWVSPASIVPGGLVGPPYTIDGFGAVTPQIQANITGADQLAFNNFHNAATQPLGGIKYGGGAYRGAIGAMTFLQTDDLLYGIAPLAPFNATDWTFSSFIQFVAASVHSAGVYPVKITISSNDALEVTATGNVGIAGGSVTLDGNVTAGDNLTVLDDFETQGNAHFDQDVQVDGNLDVDTDATVDGLITGNGGATITGVVAVDGGFGVNGDSTLGGNVSIGTSGTDAIDVKSNAPFFSNIAAQTPANIAVFSSGNVLGTATALPTLTDNIVVGTVGKGIQIKEGTNAKMGVATLVLGTVVVSTTAVTTNSRIFLTAQETGVLGGIIRVSARTAGTSFTILSTVLTDTSAVAWMIVEPAP